MKKSIICIILILSTFLIACNSSPQRKNDQSSVNATKEILQMKHYKKDINGVIFDTDIVINQGVTEDSIIKSTASLIVSDGKRLKKKFFSNKVITSNDVIAGKDSVGNDGSFTYLTSSDSSSLSFNNCSSPLLFCNKNFDGYINNCFHFIPNDEDYNAEPYANMLGYNKYKVTKAELVYRIDAFVVKAPYPINLVWVINTEETDANGSKIINIETIVDAVSWKEIINDK